MRRAVWASWGWRLCAVAGLAGGATLAHGATITSLSPQGEVARVQQVTVKFSEAVVPLGDLRQPDPISVSCDGPVPKGQGRWSNERVWLHDFEQALPPGVRCTLRARPEWAPKSGALTGRTEFSFSTGGPAVVNLQPYEGSTIAEDQHFVLRLNGPAVPSTVVANAWCEVQGIGERVPVQLVTGAAREALIKARRLEKQAALVLVLSCARPLPPQTAMRLVWGPGIASAANPQVSTRVAQPFRFDVRKAFVAEFSCERERAGAPCLPILPMSLNFSAPVPQALAAQIRLRGAAGALVAPVFDKDEAGSGDLQTVRFAHPLPENSNYSVVLPPDLRDNAGRPLANASAFPMPVRTGAAPPIAKFATAPFGVVEWSDQPLLPLTLRHVQADLRPAAGAASAGGVRLLKVDSDADIQAWMTRLNRLDGDHEQRGLSVLQGEAQARRMDLPQLLGGDPRPFEVIGIPLAQPGYHVVEVESARLGASLLENKAPMFVRTGVLVTNLGVHFKHGRQNSLVWVTTLDRAQAVPDADVAVQNCQGQTLWQGRTDAQGLARITQALPDNEGCDEEARFFVSARKTDGKGVPDMAFVLSSWQKGIEPWRFNVSTQQGAQLDDVAHTVLDRNLLRAGETVSMKHVVRTEQLGGLALLAPEQLPTTLRLVHQGSGQVVTQALQWAANRSAVSTWHIPGAAKLGVYQIELERGRAQDPKTHRIWPSGSFRVEEFRVPLVDARLSGPAAEQVAPKSLPLSLQLNYLSGGPVAKAAVRASALLQNRAVAFAGYDEFVFEPPRAPGPPQEGESDDNHGSAGGRLIADKLPLTTDAQGAATLSLSELPPVQRPLELTAEATFNDPNGEVQTISTRVPLWPSAVVPGIKAASWASAQGKVHFTALALDTAGRPLKGQRLDVRGRQTRVISTRKRMVGGFYAYDNRSEVTELGELCKGTTDARGLLLCEATLDAPGEVALIVQAADAQGRSAQAATSVWVTRQGELWFAQDNDDRIDVLPEKKQYQPGETARMQVRMPYRQATALVAVEREGIISTQLVTLRGDDPTISLKIEPGWGPNVYVSVLALRGRVRDLHWTSFFSWGWKEPLEWVRSFLYEGREYQAPTAMVDLSKPSFKLGVTQLKVGVAQHELQVSVSSDKAQYAVREKAVVTLRVTQGGQALAHAEVAFAAVDEGLLALSPNTSWDLLGAMMRPRPWGVETSTAQSEIIGRRHYGRKAVAAGGGGGRGGTRELFDTLLLWKAQVTLDAQGEARVEVPLNDSLTSFKLVAVADAGTQLFGTGSTSIRVTQDLQVLAGLPPLVREGDRFNAMLTLRNTTARELTVRATLQGTARTGEQVDRMPLPALAPQDVTLPAGGARELSWPVQVPAQASSISWEAAAQALGNEKLADRLKFNQLVVPAVPLRVMQATLQQLDGPVSLPVAAPDDALKGAGATGSPSALGGLQLGVQAKLSGALPGLRRYFETYPYSCLEQKTSRAVGLDDAAQWAAVANLLPTYLDGDGLANYFPPRGDEPARGSDRLTAYVLAATHEAGFELPGPAREAMLNGLVAFVEGRIQRASWSPASAAGQDRDVRKLAAIEALSRHGRAQPRMLGSISLTPNLWPTAAVIDWLRILQRLQAVPERTRRIDEAQQILRGRLQYAGTTLKFSNEESDFWWWLMDSADANAARLILAVLDEPGWKDELPRLVVGHLARQRRGAWLTTTANLWGSLALAKFSAKFEAQAPTGITQAQLGSATTRLDWAAQAAGRTLALPWPAAAGSLNVSHDGNGKPWLSVQSLAAVPLTAPLQAGYGIRRSVTAVERKDAAAWSRGDVLRVRLEINAQSDMTWVVVSDPVPGGATLLGSGLGRDSALATRGERAEGSAWPAYVERSFEAHRSYFEFMPRGKHVVEYTVRLNNPGRFALPPTRVEAMYSPETFGETPNAALEVRP